MTCVARENVRARRRETRAARREARRESSAERNQRAKESTATGEQIDLSLAASRHAAFSFLNFQKVVDLVFGVIKPDQTKFANYSQ